MSPVRPAAWLVIGRLAAAPAAGATPGATDAGPAPDAATAPDARAALAGRWTLDADRSDPPDALLEARGSPWIVRQVAGLGRRSMDVRVEGDTVTITLRAGLLSLDETLVVDGRPHAVDTPKGDRVVARHRWEGGALVSTIDLALADGRPATMETRREVQGDTLVVTTRLSDAHGLVTATREVWVRDR